MKQLLILFLLASMLCFPQQKSFKQLDSFFKDLSDHNKMMGTIVVSKNRQIVYKKNIGYADVSERKKIETTSKFRLASITKTFTAAMVYQLVDECKLKLTDKLSNYFSQIPNAENISITNLLTHSSGLFNITEDPDFHSWVLKKSSREDMLARMQKHPSVFEPNEKNEYSNTNFILLGYIIERIDGTSYREALQKRIASRIDLKHTYLGSNIDVTHNECHSYYYKKETLNKANETDMSNPMGAGGIVSSAIDLVRFYEALFNGELMSPKSFSKMITIKKFPFGSGIFKGEMYGQVAYGHEGSIDGFTTKVTYIPEEKTTIVVLSNAINYPMDHIASNGFLASQNKELLKPIVKWRPEELSREQIQMVAGEYEGFVGNDKVSFTFVAEGNVLKGGSNPNSLFRFKAIKKNEFVHEEFGVHLKFNIEENTLIFLQVGMNPKILTKKQ